MSGPFGEEAPGVWRDAEHTLAALRRILRKESLFAPEGRLHRFAKVYDASRSDCAASRSLYTSRAR